MSLFLWCSRCSQVIQTISAVDKDEPLIGHRFYFSLAAPVAGNLNFTLRDNKGATLLLFWDSLCRCLKSLKSFYFSYLKKKKKKRC